MDITFIRFGKVHPFGRFSILSRRLLGCDFLLFLNVSALIRTIHPCLYPFLHSCKSSKYHYNRTNLALRIGIVELNRLQMSVNLPLINYQTHRFELALVVFCLKIWKYYLYGIHICVYQTQELKIYVHLKGLKSSLKKVAWVTKWLWHEFEFIISIKRTRWKMLLIDYRWVVMLSLRTVRES